jgi:hypothetical protein
MQQLRVPLVSVDNEGFANEIWSAQVLWNVHSRKGCVSADFEGVAGGGIWMWESQLSQRSAKVGKDGLQCTRERIAGNMICVNLILGYIRMGVV